jgi:hypothetical protein
MLYDHRFKSVSARRDFPAQTMPNLEDRPHKRFAWLIPECKERKAANLKLCPHVSDRGTLGHKLYRGVDVKRPVAEIQSEVYTGALMPIDEKRDRLRQVIQGAIPTKVTKLRDGAVEAVFDTLGVLVADAKIAREFDGSQTLLPHIVSTLMRQYTLDRLDSVTSMDRDQSRQTFKVTLQLDGERAPIDPEFRCEKMGEDRIEITGVKSPRAWLTTLANNFVPADKKRFTVPAAAEVLTGFRGGQ